MQRVAYDNGYSRLLKLRYSTHIGEDEKDPILIDLSLDCASTLPPERIDPANRIAVEGIETCGYLVYPLPNQLADKLCAIMERQLGGWPSSRMKDLVDVLFYATKERFFLQALSRAIVYECEKRNMVVPEYFVAPESWHKDFEAFAKKSGVQVEFASFHAASALASNFFNPALTEPAGDMSWNPGVLRWE